MPDNFDELNSDEKLKAENEFLKMKMMLEHGAWFGGGDKPLPASIENEFLNRVIAFEQQAANPKYIKLYDKINRPTHFKPVAEIMDNEMEAAWDELAAYLHQYSVSVDVCIPNISTRELYRFVTEELFEYEMNDMNLPGMMSSFTYDEFYPDPYYDNTRVAKEECINYILEKDPLKWTHNFHQENLQLNQHSSLTQEDLKTIVNRYKAAYDDIKVMEIKETNCTVDGDTSNVSGSYIVKATTGNHTISLSGNWLVNFERDTDLGYWFIRAVSISGISF